MKQQVTYIVFCNVSGSVILHSKRYWVFYLVCLYRCLYDQCYPRSLHVNYKSTSGNCIRTTSGKGVVTEQYIYIIIQYVELPICDVGCAPCFFQNFVNVIKTCVDVLSFFQEQTLVYFQGVLLWPNCFVLLSWHYIYFYLLSHRPREQQDRRVSRSCSEYIA